MVAYFPLQNRTNSLYFSLLAGNPRGEGLARDYSLYQFCFNYLRHLLTQFVDVTVASFVATYRTVADNC